MKKILFDKIDKPKKNLLILKVFVQTFRNYKIC